MTRAFLSLILVIIERSLDEYSIFQPATYVCALQEISLVMCEDLMHLDIKRWFVFVCVYTTVHIRLLLRSKRGHKRDPDESE